VLLLFKFLQFLGESLNSLLDRQLSVHDRDQKIADGFESRTTDSEDGQGRFKFDVFRRLCAIFVVGHHLLVFLAFLNR